MRAVLTLLAVLVGSAVARIPQKCTKVSSCVCKDEYGQFVDLRPLSHNDGTPMFRDRPVDADSEPALYSFNPCDSFSEGNDYSYCKNTAVCRITKNKQDYANIGTQDSASFGFFDNGNLSLTFTGQDGKTTIVSLYCNEDMNTSSLRVVGDMGDFYWLQLRSKYCCPRPANYINGPERMLEKVQQLLSSLLVGGVEDDSDKFVPTNQPSYTYQEVLSNNCLTFFLVILVLVMILSWRHTARRIPRPLPIHLISADNDAKQIV